MAGQRSGAHPRDSREGRAARSAGARRGVEEGHESTRVVRGGGTGRGVPALPKQRLKLILALRSPELRGGPRPPRGHPRPHRCPPRRSQPASAPYLEKGTDLILLQVGLDPGLLVRRHEELRGRGLELVSPGGGCSPSGCWRLTPPPHKGCHSGRGRRRCQSPRDGANSGNWGRGGESRVPVARLAGRGAGCPQGAAGGRCLERSMVLGGEELQRRPPSPRRSALRASVSPSLSVFLCQAAPW